MLPGEGRPSWAVGVATAIAATAAGTLVVYPLREVAPAVSLGVVYLLPVLLVSTYWGVVLGIATGVASALAFNFFHLSPTGGLMLAEGENWVALGVYVAAAIAVSSLAEAARIREHEAEQRSREAELAAELARLLLGAARLDDALAPAAKRIADALQLDSAAIVLEAVEGSARHAAVPLEQGDRRIGTLIVPAAAAEQVRERVKPALEALLAAGLEREALTREVVETNALRRSDEIKTAVLRSVSHDLRSPLTAIVAASQALVSPLSEDDRVELADAVMQESRRLARLVDQLLDLSRLQTGAAEPREDWCSLEEVVRAAVEDVGASADQVKLVLASDLPLIRADATQLRRAVANLIENGLRYGPPVSVRARVSGGRILMRVVDQGPGIPLSEQERIFTPFYRAPGAIGQGSGLGLAIVRGLVEANGGRVRVESLPGQGSSFVVELPLPRPAPAKERAG